METAIIFPGMGPCRFEDMAKFMLINPFARKLFASADETLGYSLFDRYRDAEGDYSEYAQIAFFVNCLALGYWAEDTLDADPRIVAGPSFGSKAAAVFSGALSFPEAVWLTAELARAENEYFSREHQDIVTHSFVRTPEDQLALILKEFDEQGEWYDISCYIDHDFYMLSLRSGLVEDLKARLRSAGGMSLYTMRPPMHSAVFAPLRDKVEQDVFSGLRFTDPRLPVVADQDGSVLTTGDGVRKMMLDGYVLPVRWPDVVAGLKNQGVGKVFVCGPDTLFGRVACTTQNFEVVSANPRLATQPRRRAA